MKRDVVSDLKRAAAGSGAKDIADEDIDEYVAKLLLREAQEKKKKYDEIGMQAYLPRTPKPRPNTRFLLNVVKATDSHNHRSQAAKRRQWETRDEKKRRRRSPSPEAKGERKQEMHYRGRGKVRIGQSSMDKYFSTGYDPSLDCFSDQEGSKTANEHKKKKKK
ncbi:hypothetical protein BY458DRAFT_558084 [Sporodiniella umbellata]|nr:hypothetical protein BY458DRAFT_558084 [Sporodiniella umbellata]